jgi:class 3 adenylate cyclase/tetratricopeptide (TPR) repeat protein
LDTQNDRQLLAVVFTDIQGFSALTQKDEAKALQDVARYREVVTQSTDSHRGEVIHFFGDGSLSVHSSTLDAVQCAIEMQHAFASDQTIPVRVGIHLGEVVITGETVYGNAVNVASRLQHLASAHSILISGPVAKELENHPEIKLTFITEDYVKNIKEPVQVHAIVHPDLIVPSKKDIHERGAAQANKLYLGILFVILAAAVYFVTQIFDPFSQRLLDQQILVLPFDNKTGDSTLQDFSLYAAGYVSKLMEAEEEIKIVSARNILTHPQLIAFSSLPYSAISNKTNARNFIHGYFISGSDSTLVVTAGLVDGKSGNYIKQFDEYSVDPKNPTTGLVQLTQDILGFLISADYKPLATPTKDAFNAYIEALRLYGANNYEDSRHYLREAIRLDSAFIDAYFVLSDTYHNTGDYAVADSILSVIKKQFPLEAQSTRERNTFHYYEAFSVGNNVAAYKYLLNEYKENKKDLFENTTTASFALYFVNDPKDALKVLRKIPVESLDYELPDQRVRIDIGIQANFALCRYERAFKLADLYPTRDMTIEQHQMRIRAFAGVGDTSAIHHELAQVELNFAMKHYVSTLYWTAQQFSLLGNEAMHQHYLKTTYGVITENNFASEEKTLALYDMGRYREGLNHALFLHHFAPTFARYTSQVGRGYALIGKQDSAKYFCARMYELSPHETFRGQHSYLESSVYTAIGDYQTALIKLRNAVDEGLVFSENKAAFDPHLMPLFDLPEFEEIIHPLGDRPW